MYRAAASSPKNFYAHGGSAAWSHPSRLRDYKNLQILNDQHFYLFLLIISGDDLDS